MPLSLSEEVAELYYRKKGYFVTRNISYLARKRSKKQPGNMAIDILALRGKEAITVSCKRGSLNAKQEEEELETFELAKNHIISDPKWKSALEGCGIKKAYVAEYVTKHNKNHFKEHNVEVITLEEMIQELIQLLKEEMTPKMLVGAEAEILPRILKFVIEHDLMKS